MADRIFEAGAAQAILGALRFTGTNLKGNQFEVHVHSVKINPSEVDWLSPGAYGQIDLTGKILAVNGSFFTVTEALASGGASPDVLNYYSGYGNMYFTPVGGEERHMGNCPKFTTKLTPDELDHTSAMDGQGLVDDSINKATTGEISLTLDEHTLENLQIANLGGAITTGSA